jgi:hypothetical protein
MNDWFTEAMFSSVASAESAACWAGRTSVRETLIKLSRSMSRMPGQTLDLMWANLGAGKTHALLHFQQILSTDSPQAFCTYVEMPEQISSFTDLYRRILSSLPLREVAAQVVSSKVNKSEPIYRAANVLLNGGADEQQIVTDWITAGNPTIRDLRRCTGLSARIEDDVTASDMLTAIVTAFASGKRRFVILLDEYQRVGVLRPQPRARTLSSLRTVFSRSPVYFSVILSVHSMLERNAMELIPPELKTLIGGRPAIALPSMDKTEALDFILDRFKCFRPADYDGDPHAPFTSNSLKAAIAVADEYSSALTPRELLQLFGFILGQSNEPSEGIDVGEAQSLASEMYTSG